MKKFLLHTCCAPCSVAVIDELKSTYDLTVFFYNPNIYPEAEYIKRKSEVMRVCQEWGVKMIDHDYDWQNWNLAIKGLEAEKEGGARCRICINLRLKIAAKFAAENKYEIFSSTLTSGRNKRAEIIFPMAMAAAQEQSIEFYAEDWKKGGRQDKAREIVKKMQIYRQNYCGCQFSLPENLQ